MLNFMVLAPRLKKRIPSNLGSQFATVVANVVAFISNLGTDKRSKMRKLGPKSYFSPDSECKAGLRLNQGL
jgi:hypothetical protein